jgi:hypothetical protein
VNQFGDNPYESPVVQAELARPERPYQPPRVQKPWPPVFSFFWVVGGPFVCIWFMLWLIHDLKLVRIDDTMPFVVFYIVSGFLWLVAAIRILFWRFRPIR